MRVASSRLSPSVVRPEPAGGYATGALFGAVGGMAALIAYAALSGRSLSPLTWYLTRASGMTLYVLLWLSTFLGLGLTTTLLDRWGGRGTVYSLHRFATELAYGFLALHLLGLAADRAVNLGLVELLVPFASGWREPWTGFGVLAGQGLGLIGASFGLRRRTGYRAWRALHWLAFPLFALGLLHGLGAGTDAGTAWARALYLLTGSSVLCLALYRAVRGGGRVTPPPAQHPSPIDRLAPPRPTVRP